MQTLTIENNQKEGKYSRTKREVNAPDWLIEGELAGFLDDADIEQIPAFKALANFALQHMPVAFRTKKLTAQSVYAWLRGEMQGGSQERLQAITVLSVAGMDQDVLESKTTKELRSMVELYSLIGGAK